jgi:transcriptional regulator with XRE-family HTH domain
MSTGCMLTDTTRNTGMLLRQAREQAGVTQRELAERLGCTQPAISQAEAGGASLSIATLLRFAEALGCDLQLAIVSRDVALNQGVPTKLLPAPRVLYPPERELTIAASG